jgi:uncharacterized protein YPO0396
VPNSHNNRNYNQAAGGEGRRERTESSYVQGAYAQSVDTDGGGRQQTLKLRPKDTYTILLASFTNAVVNKTVTAAQVLWIANGDFNKFYVLAQHPLSIREHFQLPPSGKISDLRSRLKKTPGIEVYDTFKDYGAKIRRHFHMRSEKAMNLFNQIVSIKEVGDLNEFVRKHMLEDVDVRTSIDTLRGNYHDLTTSYEAIVKARKQLTMLLPLVKEGANYQTYTERIENLDRQLQVLPYFMDVLMLDLLQTAWTKTNEDIKLETQRKAQAQTTLDSQRQQERELYAALQNNSAVRRIQELEREINHARERLGDKQQRANEYCKLTQQLGLPAADSPERFILNQQQAREQSVGYQSQIETMWGEQQQLSVDEYRLITSLQDLREEIDQLRQRKSQIPTEQLKIRQMICKRLKFDESDLPFIGELLQVRDSDYQWEPAIQRLLNSFARRLLVPNDVYKNVRSFVDREHLGGRLVYYRVQNQPAYVSDTHLRDESVFHKLKIYPDTPYENWLKERLMADYDYICSDTLESFDRETRALTQQGQIKHGHNHYEKDDRSDIKDRRNYVLGWNNEGKVQALQEEFHRQTAEYQQVRAKLQTAKERENHLRDLARIADDLLKFTEWSRLDVETERRQIAQYEREIQGLQASSDTYKTLQQQYEQVERSVLESEKIVQQIQKILTTYQNDLEHYETRGRRCEGRLKEIDLEAYQPDFERIETDLKTIPTLDELEDVQRDLREKYQSSRSSLTGTLTRTRTAIESIMRDFALTYPQETEEVDISVAALGWYLERVKRLETDDLPAHEDRFRKLLNNSIRHSINVFHQNLEKHEGIIRRRIEQLNQSLAQIAYTNSTYIKLIARQTQQKEVVEFRQLLRNSYVNVGAADEEAENQRVFANIRDLIQRFEKDPRWTTLVTDVRNWLDFSAEERLMSDHSVHEYYQSSSGKSGGQKAKLAYTILASAIADQYGLNEAEIRAETFRFVVIDEVFSKSDEANSRFAMDLFKQLGLQVLVVTPADKIQIVEPYIGSCHYVWNNEQGNCSQLETITVEQLRDMRRREVVS